jgi:predicted ATP-grasp superfamily ATP-dependent carboligase
MSKLAVLIPDGENEHTLWTVRSLVDSRQAAVHILSSQRWTPVRFSRHCRRYQFRPGGTNHAARLGAIAEYVRRVPIDVILPVGEEGVLFASSEREHLAELAALPPLPGIDSLQTARNKWQLNQFACRHGLPVPDSTLVSRDPGFDQAMAELPYPVLLKPTSLTDGQGIMRFETPVDLRRFLEEHNGRVHRDRYLVQAYVPGFDIGLSVLCKDGQILAHTIQRGIITAAERFGPLMAMEFIRQDDVLETGRRLLAALRWNGVAHIDFRYDTRDARAKIIEMNARYWGSLLGSLVAGVNFPYLACLAAQGISFPAPAYRPSHYVYTTTVLKEAWRWSMGKSMLKGFTFEETGLRFFLADPLPEIVKRLQEKLETGRK